MSAPERTTPRRVLLTTDTVGGVWTFALELAAALAAREIEVCLATLGPRPDALQRAQVRRLAGVRLRECRSRLEWMDDPWDDLDRAAEWLMDLRSEFAPDIVHLNHFVHGDLPWGVPVVLTAHSCVLSWWRAVHGVDAPPAWAHYAARVAGGLAAASVVVAPTRAMLADIVALYGPPRSARVVANGREPGLFRRSFKEPIVLSVGRLWDPAKNLAALDRVAPRLLWPVCVAGDTTSPDGRSAEPGSAFRLGRLDPAELATWYARAAIFAHPARYEPFGLAPLEAAFSGCALVLGDIPALQEVWRGAAVYVTPDDPEHLVTALRALISDPRKRTLLAERARRRAARYVPERMADEYLDVYTEARLAPRRPFDTGLKEVM